MAKRRALRSAMSDPLVKKKRVQRITAQEKSSKRPVPTPARKIGYVALAAAVTAGFIGGWLARRWLRMI